MKSNISVLVIAACATLNYIPAQAVEVVIDLTNNADKTLKNVVGDVGGVGLVGNFSEQPAGTGVFKPFLTIEREARGGNPRNLEHGYNTDGVLYLDQQRPQWNTLLRLGDLETITIGGASYFTFILDANEPGASKSDISIDNVRIYSSLTDNTFGIQSDETKINQLGDLRWAMNDPLNNLNGTYNTDTWIKLDASQNDSNKNGGSGIADLILHVPVLAFAGVSPDAFVWFYNLNGVKFSADSDLAAEAGYEEWKALTTTRVSVPDGGNTLWLLAPVLGLIAAATSTFRLAAKD